MKTKFYSFFLLLLIYFPIITYVDFGFSFMYENNNYKMRLLIQYKPEILIFKELIPKAFVEYDFHYYKVGILRGPYNSQEINIINSNPETIKMIKKKRKAVIANHEKNLLIYKQILEDILGKEEAERRLEKI